MHSKKKLFKDLAEAGFENPSLEAPEISDETYGRKSFIYINCRDMDHRCEIEEFLLDRGYKVSRPYWPSAPRIEVQVSYFKGFHWNV